MSEPTVEAAIEETEASAPLTVDGLLPKWKRQPGKRGRLSNAEIAERDDVEVRRALLAQVLETKETLRQRDAYKDSVIGAKDEEIKRVNGINAELTRAQADASVQLANRANTIECLKGHITEEEKHTAPLVQLVVSQLTMLVQKHLQPTKQAHHFSATFTDGTLTYTVIPDDKILVVHSGVFAHQQLKLDDQGITAKSFLMLASMAQISPEQLRTRLPKQLVERIFAPKAISKTGRTTRFLGAVALADVLRVTSQAQRFGKSDPSFRDLIEEMNDPWCRALKESESPDGDNTHEHFGASNPNR